jgi:hypothetical protein
MPLSANDKQFEFTCANNVTPLPADGSGSVPLTLCGYCLANDSSVSLNAKFYDKATAPVVGTDTPKRTVFIPADTTLQADFVRGKQFVNGLWVAVTVNASGSDNTAPAAGALIGTVDYQ